ncbi:hypothetical protein NXY41_04535 [Bacteroides fragilis]|nr:hypothetical protein [Bacteroides fragilis]MCS2877874.1 hypothetical protein [Bacteroides fragilis]
MFYTPCFTGYPVYSMDADLMPLSFYILYLTEWFISFVRYFGSQGMTDPGRASHRAYMSSAMEMEAKTKEVETGYLERRKHFAFMRYYDKI